MVRFSEAGTKKFFRKHAAQADQLRTQISEALEKQTEMNFSKVKPATHLQFEGSKVWEIRVNPVRVPPVRVAFTVAGSDFVVVFVSHTIQKSEFTHELEKFLRG